jgi:hypothetical protein
MSQVRFEMDEVGLHVVHPADDVSDAFINHAYSRSEVSSFVSFYHKMAAAALKPDTPEFDHGMYKEYRGHSIYFVESYLCRISDLFDYYLECLVFFICRERSDFFDQKFYSKAREQLVKLGVTAPTDDDIYFECALSFCRRSKEAIAEHFQKVLAFDLVAAAKNWNEILLCGRIRNLIVHKASVMDERFVDLLRPLDCPFSVEIGKYLIMPERWAMELASKVDFAVAAIDEAILACVPINKRDRWGHIWMPRSTWANPTNEDNENK